MTTDPNADLIGFEFPVDSGDVAVVIGSAPWDSGYVLVESRAGRTVRVASQVRRRKELGP